MTTGQRVHLSVEYVARVVDDFYDRVLQDPSVAGWFAGVAMAPLRAHQTEFLLAAFGAAPDQATRPEVLRQRLQEGHRGLAIDQEAFDRAAGHLAGALADHGMERAQLDETLDVLYALASHVVGVQA